MQATGKNSRESENLPEKIYISTVDALYSDGRSLFVGSLSAIVAALVTYWKSGEPALLACALATVALGLLRIAEMRQYARSRPDTIEDARLWEARYIRMSGANVLVLGVWCFLCFALTQDAAIHLISFSMVLAYLLGIAGRNFSSDRLVVIQTACAAVLMIGGLLYQNNIYYHFLALLFVPFFISIRIIATRLRNVLFDAVIAKHDIESLANRFDTALTNMPHGLCMFDGQKKVVVTNGRFNELLGLPADVDMRGIHADELCAACIANGTIPAARSERFTSRFMEALTNPKRKSVSLPLQGRKTLQLTFQPMADGGSVMLVEDITERRRAEAKIERLARFDTLTGLPNRMTFTERFEYELSSHDSALAILFVDLDQFKQVNDTLGHPCGDTLLCEVADRLRSVVRRGDVVARFGGDEFVILQKPSDGTESAAHLARRIIEVIEQSFSIDGHQIMIGASIGIALSPGDGNSTGQLLKNADIALYRAKADGRGVYRFFEPEMDEKARARRLLELELRAALTREEFEVFYQPIIDIKTGKPASYEALLRWRHPQRGMVSPAEFIPVAEEMGLIVDIGNWVLRKACSDCNIWPSHIRVAVNLSPLQFRRANVVAVVADALKKTGLAPHRLELEITESVLMDDTDAAGVALQQLRDLGVTIALDDFGTGYSSLSYLHAFPLDKIKIDRSFLEDIDTDKKALTLLRGVARLSAELGMSVVMEGVETNEQLAVLIKEGSFSNVQGFLFGRPMPVASILDLQGLDRPPSARVA